MWCSHLVEPVSKELAHACSNTMARMWKLLQYVYSIHMYEEAMAVDA